MRDGEKGREEERDREREKKNSHQISQVKHHLVTIDVGEIKHSQFLTDTHIATCKMCVPLLLLLKEANRYIKHGGNIVKCNYLRGE